MTGGIEQMARGARAAALSSARLNADQRREALEAMAEAIETHKSEILAANALDLAAADENGVTGAMRDRLELDEAGVAKLAEAIREVAGQEDPLGALEDESERPNGLRIGG